MFFYALDISKVIYTTNAIESLNSVIRHAIKKHKVFPSDDSVKRWCGWSSPCLCSDHQCCLSHRRHCEHYLTNDHQTPSCLRPNPYRPPITLK
ncbi:hypothetical protein C5471_05995 [Photorhabdus tasmaniensis]|uniref:Mutator family transposase n=1 Tax=Photorhabdus tasmaniensis TaxID=1004159 RepID=A0ABX0GET0_9GAMM|nr:hypothetical protein [Photorhabdus tasmaniensis]